MFEGYSDETFEFFMAIRFNNNMDFFHANHDWYLRGVREPSLALAAALSPAIEALDDGLERRPNRVVSRINRDIRFSNDKSPYRDYLWLSFHQSGEDRSSRLELYFDISADGASYGMGYFRPERALMDGLRRRILTEPDALAGLWQALQSDFRAEAHSYRRMKVPEAVPDALRPFYTARGLYFTKPVADFGLLKSPALADEIIAGIERLTPMYRYLESLTPVDES